MHAIIWLMICKCIHPLCMYVVWTVVCFMCFPLWMCTFVHTPLHYFHYNFLEIHSSSSICICAKSHALSLSLPGSLSLSLFLSVAFNIAHRSNAWRFYVIAINHATLINLPFSISTAIYHQISLCILLQVVLFRLFSLFTHDMCAIFNIQLL